MTFDAGSIEATLTLDRRPFQSDLAAAKKDAQDFAKGKYTATLGVDDKAMKAELDALKLKLDEITRDREIKIKVKSDSGGPDDNGLKSVKKDADDAEKSIGGLMTAIILLGPALVPLAGGLTAIGAGVAGLGISGVTAFVGIKNEITANTAAGKEFKSLLGSLKGDLATVSQTSALSAQGGITQAVAKLKSDVPQLNGFLSQSSTILGDVVSHLAGGLVGGLKAFTPLILEVETGIDHIASSFEKWATGPGGEKFASTLSKDYAEAVPALKSLSDLVVKLFTVLNGSPGVSTLKLITAFADTISSFPTPVLQVIVDGIIALKLASTAAIAIDLLSASLIKLGAAEDVAGGGGAAGGIGKLAFLSGLVPVAAGLLAVGVGAKAASSSLGDYVNQTSQAKYETGQLLDSIGKVFTGHVFSGFSDIFSNNTAHNNFVSSVNQMSYDIGANQGGQQELNFETNNPNSVYVPGVQAAGPGLAKAQPSLLGSTSASIIKQYGMSSTAISSAISTASAVVGKAQANYVTALQGTGAGAQQSINNAKSQLDAAQKSVTDLVKAQSALSFLQQKASSDAAIVNSTKTSYVVANQNSNTQGFNYADNQSTYANATSGLATYSAQLQKSITAEGAFNAIQIDSQGNVDKTSKSLAAWKTALAEANGNTVIATGLVYAHQQAYGDDTFALNKAQAAQLAINGAVSDAAEKYGLTSDQVQAYGSIVGVTSKDLTDSTNATKLLDTAVGDVATTLNNGSTAVQGYITAVSTFIGTTDTAATRAQLFGATLVAANGDTISYQLTLANAAAANQTLVTAMVSAKKGIIDWKDATVDWHKAGAAPVLSDLAALQTAAESSAEAILQHAKATGDANGADEAFAAYQAQTQGALEKTAISMGASKKQADAFATSYFGIKNAADLQKSLTLFMNAQPGADLALLGNISKDLDIIAGKTQLPPINIPTDKASAALQALINKQEALLNPNYKPASVPNDGSLAGSFPKPKSAPGQADGGVLPMGVSAVGERGPELAITDAHGSMILSTPQSKKFLALTGMTAPGFSGGTVSDYDPNNFGFTGVDYSSGSSSSSSSSTSKYKTLFAAIVAELTKLSGASKMTAGNLSSLVSTMETSAKTAESYGLITSKSLTSFITDGTKLNAVTTLLGTAESKLTTDTASFYSVVAADKATTLGGFNIGTSGNGYGAGILESANSAVADASKFADLIRQARKIGLNPNYISQLIQEGPTQAGANLQAIISAATGPGGGSYLSALNSDYTQLSQLGNALGDTDANIKYGAVLTADKAAVAKDSAAQLAALAQIHKDLVAVEAAVSKKTKS